MKILFCDNGLNSFLNFREYIAYHFHKNGYEVGVAVPSSSCTEQALSQKPAYLSLFSLDMNRNGANPLTDVSYCYALIKLFSKEKPDIIFTYTIKPNIYGSIAANWCKIPIVSMVAGLGYAFSENSIKHKLGRTLYKYGLKQANKVIVLNKSDFDFLKDNRFVTVEKLTLFSGGEGVDLNRFNYVYDDYSTVRFLMLPRVLYDKGYSEYVEAAKIVKRKYPNVEFDLLGPMATDSPMGVPADVVTRDVETGSINYLGETNNVAEYVGRKGIVVVLVSSYKEGLNRSLMEACAMGRICITSNVPGCKEIVDNGINGYVIPPKNSKELAKSMIEIISTSSTARRNMARNSFAKARDNFNVILVCKNYDEILRHLLFS